MNLYSIFKKFIKLLHNRRHYPYQYRIARAILEGIEASKRGEVVEIAIELPRQSGKTTTVVDVAEMLLMLHHEAFGEPLSIGIFAPQREQATTDFERLKTQYGELPANLGLSTKAKTDADTKMPEKWNSKSIRLYSKTGTFLGEVYIFPLAKTSNPESKTLGLILIEEAQQVDDKKMQNSVFPMGASTNAPRVLIGTAGTRICYFKKLLETSPRAIRVSLEEVFADRRATAVKTGDEKHLRYETYVRHEIETNGFDSDYIKTQYRNIWVIGTGQFCTDEQLTELVGEDQDFIHASEKAAYVGIDTAKSPDQTVVTVLIDDDEDPLKSKLAGWLSLRGENYSDQFDIIKDWLAPKWEEYEENGKKKKRLLSGFPEVRAIAMDATGQGDFMPDMFERHSDHNVIRCKFTLELKDVLYKLLLQVIHNKMTSIPDKPKDKDFIGWKTEMLNLEKEYKGRFMSVHHPDDPNAHDDYPDSWALAEYAKTEMVKNEPTLRIL